MRLAAWSIGGLTGRRFCVFAADKVGDPAGGVLSGSLLKNLLSNVTSRLFEMHCDTMFTADCS